MAEQFAGQSSRVRDLSNILSSAAKVAGVQFSGLGVLVSDAPDNLPLFPLRPDLAADAKAAAAEVLGEISVVGGPLHDGFHILSAELSVSRLSQYFSPPIVPNLVIDRQRPIGGRYLAALFGSKLPAVMMSAIATPAHGIVIFADGEPIYRRYLAC